MQKSVLPRISAFILLLLLTLTGCSRTVNDVEKWKIAGNERSIIKALQDPKSDVRKAAVDALGELKSDAAANPLGTLLSDPEEAIHERVVIALIAIGTPEAHDQLVKAVDELTPLPLRVQAAEALGNQQATRAIPALLNWLKEGPLELRCAAAVSIGQMGDSTVSAALADQLSAKEAELRLRIVEALGKTAGEEAITGLCRALADEEADVHIAAIKSLIIIGNSTLPAVEKQLQHSSIAARRGAIQVLTGLNASPSAGEAGIWYLLASESINDRTELNLNLVQQLAGMGNDIIPLLLDAASHTDADIRLHATRTLEEVGQPALAAAIAKVEHQASPSAQIWFEKRSTWSGAPSPQLDLWAATAALNPQFELDEERVAQMQAQSRAAFNAIVSPNFQPTSAYIPFLIQLLGDNTAPPPPQPEFSPDGIPIVRKKVDPFRGEANQRMAKDKLLSAQHAVIIPLIAALNDPSDLIQNHAATLLCELGDQRAVQPLIQTAQRKLEAGEELSDTDLYRALVLFNHPDAEPLLLRVRPTTDRAIQLFERQYNIPVSLGEAIDKTEETDQGIHFRMGYLLKGRVINTMMTMHQSQTGHWIVHPPLPDQLPQ
jgi:HEAT repeat protein